MAEEHAASDHDFWAEECEKCGERDCPFGCDMHYHHDGCPACYRAGCQTIDIVHESDTSVTLEYRFTPPEQQQAKTA